MNFSKSLSWGEWLKLLVKMRFGHCLYTFVWSGHILFCFFFVVVFFCFFRVDESWLCIGRLGKYLFFTKWKGKLIIMKFCFVLFFPPGKVRPLSLPFTPPSWWGQVQDGLASYPLSWFTPCLELADVYKISVKLNYCVYLTPILCFPPDLWWGFFSPSLFVNSYSCLQFSIVAYVFSSHSLCNYQVIY